MAREHKLTLGKVDYNGSGRKNCEAEITWKMDGGKFSMQAGIWNPRHSDYYMCGQCVEEVAAYFPRDAKVQRMLAVWREYHLHDMKAGSPAQTAWIKANPSMKGYDEVCQALTAAGLNPDPGYLHDGKPYRYGSAWLKTDLPADIVAEIEAWSAPADAIA